MVKICLARRLPANPIAARIATIIESITDSVVAVSRPARSRL